jgi:hypothetical protein
LRAGAAFGGFESLSEERGTFPNLVAGHQSPFDKEVKENG